VVVIAEGHLLDNPQLEAIRMLTNHDMDSGSLRHCKIAGPDRTKVSTGDEKPARVAVTESGHD
jgi:hypothetical protein